MPKVSVIMPAFNAERYVGIAIESILCQSFTDFEFLVIDDGSSDDTWDIICSCADPRLIAIRNTSNLGLTCSLNTALTLAQGHYIARQDADDISLPFRLQRQIETLDREQAVGLVGTWWSNVDERGRGLQHVRVPTDSSVIRESLPVDLVITHALVMFRRRCIDEVGAYRPEAGSAEDLDLWLRIADRFEITNVPEELYQVRVHGNSVVASNLKSHLDSIHDVLKATLERWDLNRVAVAPSTIARCHLRLACHDLLSGRPLEAAWNKVLAMEKYPALAASEQSASEIARFALYACTLSQSTPAIGTWMRLGTQYIDQFLDLVSGEQPVNASAIYARFLVTAAYDSYIHGRFRDSAGYALSSMSIDRSWLRNRALWRLALHSLLHRRIIL